MSGFELRLFERFVVAVEQMAATAVTLSRAHSRLATAVEKLAPVAPPAEPD